MLVVVTIIALFAGLVGLRMWKQADKARVTAARAQINTLMAALSTYKMDTGQFPTTEQGLQVLRTAPPGVTTGKALTWSASSPTIPGAIRTFTTIPANRARSRRSSLWAPTGNREARASTPTL